MTKSAKVAARPCVGFAVAVGASSSPLRPWAAARSEDFSVCFARPGGGRFSAAGRAADGSLAPWSIGCCGFSRRRKLSQRWRLGAGRSDIHRFRCRRMRGAGFVP